MNYIQRAWLVALRPVITLVNDKMAKRSGFIGKIGRFFAFGPRQYGFHTTNKILLACNRLTLAAIPFFTARYSVIKYPLAHN
jgi:hypothetical protein